MSNLVCLARKLVDSPAASGIIGEGRRSPNVGGRDREGEKGQGGRVRSTSVWFGAAVRCVLRVLERGPAQRAGGSVKRSRRRRRRRRVWD